MRFAPYGGILSRAVEQDDPLHGPQLANDLVVVVVLRGRSLQRWPLLVLNFLMNLMYLNICKFKMLTRFA